MNRDIKRIAFIHNISICKQYNGLIFEKKKKLYNKESANTDMLILNCAYSPILKPVLECATVNGPIWPLQSPSIKEEDNRRYRYMWTTVKKKTFACQARLPSVFPQKI